MLRLSKAQLEAALAHVSTAVEPDTALRAFLAPNSTGLVYTCEQGGCTCADPAGALRLGGAAGRWLGAAHGAQQTAGAQRRPACLAD